MKINEKQKFSRNFLAVLIFFVPLHPTMNPSGKIVSDNLVIFKRRYVYTCHVKTWKIFNITQGGIVHSPRICVGCCRYIFVIRFSKYLT